MADYSVDIALKVKGQKDITKLTKAVNQINKSVKQLVKLTKQQTKIIPKQIDNINKKFEQTNKKLRRIKKEAKETTKELQRLSKVPGPQSGGSSGFGQQRSRRSRIIQSAGIGGGFPLLFGGGPVGAIAGGLGGAIGEAATPGGGFAGSIVASAVARIATDFTNNITEVGKAMNESSKEFERVQNIVGVEGANKISAFTTQTQTLTKTFGDFILSLQAGVAGLLNIGGVLNSLIAMMQRDVARREAARSDSFKKRTKNLRGQGGQGIKRRQILNEETDIQFEKNVQGFADAQALTSAELIQASVKGLEREGFLHDANTEKMRKALEIRFQHEDIMEKLVKAGAEVSDQESDYILKLLEEKQIREENLKLQNAMKNLVANDMGNAMKDLITGAKSFNDVMKNALNNMANAFLNLGIFGNVGGSFERGQGLLGKIFRAEGGPVKGGKSYVVGERGPEMFTPGVSGMVTPNHALGGSTTVVVNVDASGSSIEGDETQGRELGRAISVAVQSEILQQKRPGGLLA